jgi:hypothetical protein
VVERVAVFYWGEPDQPVFALTSEYDTPGVCETELRYGLITTQTCDIGEEDSKAPSRPWVHVAPVYDGLEEREGSCTLDGGQRKLIARGRVQHFLHLPGLADGFWVADLRLLLPFDKGWLHGRQPIDPFQDERARHEVGRRLAYLHRRPAFDPHFVRVVQQPLMQALNALGKSDAEQYEVLFSEVVEIGVHTDSNIAMTFAEVWALCDGEPSEATREWLCAQWDEWRGNAADVGLTLLPLRIESLEALSAAQYRSLTTVPLANISPSAEWYGPDPYEPPIPTDG